MEISAVSIASVFAAGLISFLSPCVLPLVPGYVSYVAGGSLEELRDDGLSRRRLAALMLSAFFVLGFTSVFVALGASASAVGTFLLQHKTIFEYAAGGVIIVFGLYLAGLVRIPFFEREARFAGRLAGGRPASAFLLGAAFAFGWTPCIGPVLGGILTMTATSADVGRGVALLAIYSLGLGVPFLIAAAFTGAFLRHMKRIRKVSRPLQIAAGVIMVAMGVALITGYLSSVAFWLLEAFPGLAAIG
jgi:cytochrome c-type biogenesis protein